jgi:hypothetical protein
VTTSRRGHDRPPERSYKAELEAFKKEAVDALRDEGRTLPFLCRLGFHRFEYSLGISYRECQRCHRAQWYFKARKVWLDFGVENERARWCEEAEMRRRRC